MSNSSIFPQEGECLWGQIMIKMFIEGIESKGEGGEELKGRRTRKN